MVISKEELDKNEREFSVSSDTQIFKYMDISKFMCLLQGKLYFCDTKAFEDKYEGEMPKAFYEEHYKDWLREEDVKNSIKLNEALKKTFRSFVCSWNLGESESYALWKIYTNPETGVAIKSTVGNLKNALGNNGIEIYKVEYIDFEDENKKIPAPPIYNRKQDAFYITRYLGEVYKDKPYTYEEEVRAVYLDISKDTGISFSVDLNILINDIYISPFAPKWFEDLIVDIARKYRLSDKNIIKSKILINK